MKIERSSESSTSIINISSLVDIMFILIIFFLATTTFRQEERDATVNLPETAGAETLSSSTDVLVVNVRKNGDYLLGSQPLDINKLASQMQAAVEENSQQKVLIRGDKQAMHGNVAAAVLACRRAGVKKANIGYMVGKNAF